MNNLEELMRDLVRSSVLLRQDMYHRKQLTAPRIVVHVCRLCNRAAGNREYVRHRYGCPLAKLQKSQKRLRAAWPELFANEPASQETHGHQGAVAPTRTRRNSTVSTTTMRDTGAMG